VGFTIAEGSFVMKSNKAAFYSIRQTGLVHQYIIQSIALTLLDRVVHIKVDSANSYQLSVISKSDIQKIVYFFNIGEGYNEVLPRPNKGYKLEQFNAWIEALKKSSRYNSLFLLIPTSSL